MGLLTLKFRMIVGANLVSVALLSGCAGVRADLQSLEFPPDTPILIGSVAYQVNMFKCARIRAVTADGALDCYDGNGQQSAAMTPVSDFRRKLVEEHLGMAWSSPKHQEYVFQFFYGGGQQQAATNIAGSLFQARDVYASTKSSLDSIDKSRDIADKSAQLKANGAAAYMTGGMPGWQAYQSDVLQWRLDNSRYFIERMNVTTPVASD